MKKEHLYPDFFARFYDVIYDHIRSSADHDYFMHKILEANGPVLEVGAGTGRFFTEALKNGADIYGIDISPAMTEVLKQKLPAKDHHRVSVQDVCKLKMNKKFKLILAPFRVFMHLTTIEEQLSALHKVHEHLEAGGLFIFDLFVPNLKLLNEGIENANDFTGEYEPGKILKRYSTMHADLIRQISHVKFRFEWDENGKIQSKEWVTELRFFFRYELEHLLRCSAFDSYKIYGDFSENELTKDSKEFVVVCRKD